ncbi:hypothetical protein ACFSFY_11145 [Sporosarcina siberiensis]|uniref:DUF4825 domain-containing protein n=1 Tax=Sporosarcina siberiensis TaxID=1365606 RepID=A0ABW4SI91_9BACL
MKFKTKYIVPTVFLLVFFSIFLVACTDNDIELNDGDTHLSEELNNTISNYIVQQYSTSSLNTEKQFEVHKVYGTSEKNDVTTVYFWSYYGGFNKSTGAENQSGHSLPAVMQLKKESDHYTVVKYTEPEDGDFYQSSIKKMFPKKYLKRVYNDSGNSKDLEKEMDVLVKQWLAE